MGWVVGVMEGGEINIFNIHCIPLAIKFIKIFIE